MLATVASCLAVRFPKLILLLQLPPMKRALCGWGVSESTMAARAVR